MLVHQRVGQTDTMIQLDEHPALKNQPNFDENERDSPGLQKLDSSKLSGEKNDAPKRGTRF